MKLTSKQWRDKGIAYAEAADHLDETWSDDRSEIEQGNSVSMELREKAATCFMRSREARKPTQEKGGAE